MILWHYFFHWSNCTLCHPLGFGFFTFVRRAFTLKKHELLFPSVTVSSSLEDMRSTPPPGDVFFQFLLLTVLLFLGTHPFFFLSTSVSFFPLG